MLFEMGENPKVIQAILGHKDVRTTITIYNSVDQEYIRKSTEKLNEKFNVDENNQTEVNRYEEMNKDDLDKLIAELEQAKRKRKREKDFEM